MPSMNSITVQNSSAANVVFDAATPSAGDRVPAQWRNISGSAKIGFRPHFSLLTRDNAKKNGRIIEGVFKYPIVDGTTGSLLATVPLSFSGTLPTNVDASQVNNAFVLFGNLLVSTLVRDVAATGYAPT